MKTTLTAIAIAAVCLQTFAADAPAQGNTRTSPFMLGAEISWVPEDEADGAVYYDHGVKKDIFAILKDYQFNYIRLRLFVDPASTNGYARRRTEGFCDLEHVKALAKRAKAAGMGILLDIHYGDTWTSPGHQDKPVAWKDFNFPELTQAVHDFTHQAIFEMKTNGTPANLVQIGNEISDGMLFPDGRRSNFDNFATLVKAGIAGAREADPSIKIVLHHHLGRSNARMREWIDNFLKRGTDFDIIGMSCYAQAQEGDWKTNFDDLATRYPDKGLLVVEYSARKRFINDLMFNTPDQKGLGTFIWEPTRHREALFDKNGKNAGGGQSSNFTTDQGVNQGARLARTNSISATNLPAGATNATNIAVNTNSPEFIYRSFGTNEAARAEWRKHRFGGHYDANELLELYPQMAKDYVGVAPAHEISPVNAPAPLTNTTPVILTPSAPDTPRFNGPKIFGVRPGSPFLYTIPASGQHPMKFSADNLPRGLKLDAKTGRITGTLKKAGEFNVILRATNALGAAEKPFRIVVGDRIALTPPMGWNSWNCFASAVSADKVRRAAEALVQSGLAQHGWSYINIDDYWQVHRNSKDPTLQGPQRARNGRILPNPRFPDMKQLTDDIHALGLKAGIYSSPGPWTCGGCVGSWQHEEQDAKTYAAWGFDYLKYDWCSYGSIASGKVTNTMNIPLWGKTATNDAGAIYPYKVMGDFLRKQKRDIVFSLCQYGMADVWKWGASVNGNSWRTTGDITDTWKSMSGIGFKQDRAAPFAGPGHWNDPDMLVVGQVGWGKPHPTRLTPDEQYTHISLWCLLSAPLLIGCDLEKLDDFTLSLLTNDEVLAVDQDLLGQQAICVSSNGTLRVFAKDLDDGTKAAGLFNLGDQPATVVANWDDLKLTGAQLVRDLWRQKDLGRFEKEFSATVASHGVVLVEIQPAAK